MQGRRLTHGSLFSGVGGAELAAHWAGFSNLFHCEINPFGRKVLDYWFPNSESYEDVTRQDFTKWRGRVDVLSGGFPCQPFSSAGRRKGSGDDRYLWPQMLRAIREIKPAFVIGENVNGILSMVEPRERFEVESEATLFDTGDRRYREVKQFTIERICQDLEKEGYDVQPFVIPACAVGAPHRRDRVWIIAKRRGFRPDEDTLGYGLQRDSQGAPSARDERDVCAGDTQRVLQGFSSSDPDGGGGDARGTLCFSVGKDDCQGRDDLRAEPNGRGEQTAPHASGSRLQEIGTQADIQEPRLGRLDTDGFRLQGERGAIPRPSWQAFPTQSPLLGGDDGLPFGMDALTIPYGKFRTETIKAMGNAWVPQVAYELFKAIAKQYNALSEDDKQACFPINLLNVK